MECQGIIFYFRYADQLAIGDEVLVQVNGVFTPEMILNVSYSMMQGDYNFHPLFSTFYEHQKHHVVQILCQNKEQLFQLKPANDITIPNNQLSSERKILVLLKANYLKDYLFIIK